MKGNVKNRLDEPVNYDAQIAAVRRKLNDPEIPAELHLRIMVGLCNLSGMVLTKDSVDRLFDPGFIALFDKLRQDICDRSRPYNVNLPARNKDGWHGIIHASTVAFSTAYLWQGREYRPEAKVFEHLPCHFEQLCFLLALSHDIGRRGDGEDKWELHTIEYVFDFLEQQSSAALQASSEDEKARAQIQSYNLLLALMVGFKDSSALILSLLDEGTMDTYLQGLVENGEQFAFHEAAEFKDDPWLQKIGWQNQEKSIPKLLNQHQQTIKDLLAIPSVKETLTRLARSLGFTDCLDVQRVLREEFDRNFAMTLYPFDIDGTSEQMVEKMVVAVRHIEYATGSFSRTRGAAQKAKACLQKSQDIVWQRLSVFEGEGPVLKGVIGQHPALLFAVFWPKNWENSDIRIEKTSQVLLLDGKRVGGRVWLTLCMGAVFVIATGILVGMLAFSTTIVVPVALPLFTFVGAVACALYYARYLKNPKTAELQNGQKALRSDADDLRGGAIAQPAGVRQTPVVSDSVPMLKK